ncbi:MAG: hypothetical protein VR65_15365 [Desulfobulbaceae bacterium BRH_c16a]|nr:MAG: hypothetical protein VR65_15365 [Desulfobulbaceae bacterium BRH_c16a]
MQAMAKLPYGDIFGRTAVRTNYRRFVAVLYKSFQVRWLICHELFYNVFILNANDVSPYYTDLQIKNQKNVILSLSFSGVRLELLNLLFFIKRKSSCKTAFFKSM